MEAAPMSAPRIPTPKDERIREAMAALITNGSPRKAAAACGIPKTNIERWAASDEGKLILDELRGSEGSPRAARMFAIVDKLLDRLEKAIDADEIPVTALAVNIGILTDKAKALMPKAEDQTGEVVVQVFGGTLATATAPAQGVAVQVTTKGGRNG